jgi:hypothetical protein
VFDQHAQDIEGSAADAHWNVIMKKPLACGN